MAELSMMANNRSGTMEPTKAPRIAQTIGGRAHHLARGDEMAKRTPAVERFWPKVDRNGPIPDCAPDLGRCWIWTAAGAEGYGAFWDGDRQVQAYRWSYEHFIGLIPEGLVIDHLCRTPACVNPSHLEPVPQRVNVLRGDSHQAQNARKTHCPQGHPYDEANTYHRRGGGRDCRECMKSRSQNRRRRAAARSQDLRLERADG